MLTVLCWLWRQPGGRAGFAAEHVNIWAAMVRRHLAMPHRLACVTDMAEGIDARIEIVAPPGDFADLALASWGPHRPQCLRRLALFRPDAGAMFGARFVSMDLDVVIAGPMDPLLDGDEAFRICRGSAPGRPYNGSMLLMTAGARPQVFEAMSPALAAEAGRRFVGSDQAVIAHVLGAGEATWGREDGVGFWGQGSPRTVTFFPGATKPWQVADEGFCGHVAAHYRGDRRGRCLVLGHAPSVWAEAEVALALGPVDAVIASPEAAEHWPGPVLAVASDDAHAERLVAMHGFSNAAWCGQQVREAA